MRGCDQPELTTLTHHEKGKEAAGERHTENEADQMDQLELYRFLVQLHYRGLYCLYTEPCLDLKQTKLRQGFHSFYVS